jgi:hypothetical protein
LKSNFWSLIWPLRGLTWGSTPLNSTLGERLFRWGTPSPGAFNLHISISLKQFAFSSSYSQKLPHVIIKESGPVPNESQASWTPIVVVVSHSPPHIMSFLDIPRGSCPQAIFRLKYHQLLSCFLGLQHMWQFCIFLPWKKKKKKKKCPVSTISF